MLQARGYKSKLVAEFETAYGITPAIPAGILLPINDFKVAAKQNLIASGTIRGRRDEAPPALGTIDVTGTATVPVDEVNFGYWLKMMFGVPTTTGSADPYSHLFKLVDTQPSMAFEEQFPDVPDYKLLNGCKVNKFSMSFDKSSNKELTATIDLIGQKETHAVTSAFTAPTTLSLAKFYDYQLAIKEGGVALATVSKADFAMDFGLDTGSYALDGTPCRAALPEGLTKVTGNVTAFFGDMELLNKAINSTMSSLELTLTNGTHSLGFAMQEIIYQLQSPAIDSAKGVLVTLPFTAFYNAGAANSAFQATLINGHASYAADI
jgi:hypothetical protein